MTRHQIVEEARHTRCGYCGAAPGHPCVNPRAGACLRRITRAHFIGRVPGSDWADCIDDGLTERGGVGFVLDPEVTR
jgi:hypothetical protein